MCCSTLSLDDWEKISKIAAIVLAWIVAYYKFLRGKTFTSRFEPSISGSIYTRDEQHYLVMYVSVKNVGASRVKLNKEMTKIGIIEYNATRNEYGAAIKEDVHEQSLFVFQDTDELWLEPGETVRRVATDIIVDPLAVYRIRFQVFSDRMFGKHNNWLTSSVAIQGINNEEAAPHGAG